MFPEFSPLQIFFPENCCRLGNGAQLPVSDSFNVYGTTGKTAKTTVSVKKKLIGTVILQSFFGFADNKINRLNHIGPGIDHAQTELPVMEGTADDINITCSRGGVFQDELVDFHMLQCWKQFGVIPGKKHVLLL